MSKLYLYPLLKAIGFCLLLAPVTSWAQCSGQIEVIYPSGTSTATTTLSNGQGTFSGTYCPVSPGQASIRIIPKSASRITITRDSDGQVIGTRTATAGDVRDNSFTGFTFPLDVSSTTNFTLTSTITNCNSPKPVSASFSLTPSLSLSANVASVCRGGNVTVTASGGTTSTNYTWFRDGIRQPETGPTITRGNLTASTTFRVTASAGTCGVSTQQLTVPISELSLNRTSATICANTATSFTANYSGTSATFNWYDLTADPGLTTPVFTSTGKTSTFTTPVLAQSRTYRVRAVTPDCGTLPTQDANVVIGPLTVSLSASTARVCSGGGATFTATANNPAATYRWYEVLASGATGDTVALATTPTFTFTTANNTQQERYRVIATVAACNATAQADVTIDKINSVTNTVTPAASTVCAGTTATFTASSDVTNATYAWTESTRPAIVLSTAPTLTVSPTSNTTYNVTITTGCGSQTFARTVTVNSAVQVSPAQSQITAGGGVTLTATGPAGATYTWAIVSGSTVTTIPGANSATLAVNPVVTTTYRAIGANTGSTSCATTADATVFVSSTPLTLPVELISFAATWADRHPRLTWATAMEKNSAYFEVERSFDGKQFAAVGQRPGAGNTTSRTNYQFTDASLAQTSVSVVYYRLRQVDADGTATVSAIVPLTVPGAVRAFKASAYPNPYQHQVAVTFEAVQAGEVSMTLQDMLGRPVLRHTQTVEAGVQELALPRAAALPAGVYYLVLSQGNQKQMLKLSHQ